MGCDGGTIPKRNEIVKNKRKDQARDKDADLSAKWQYCSLSGLKLKKPIVACHLGRLYNKLAIVEHLLERQAQSSKNAPPSSSSTISQSDDPISHIRCLNDIKELTLKERDDKAQATSSTAEQFKVPFVCPISGLEISGKYKFYYLVTCGCVFSERALKEVPNEKQCIICYKPYDPDIDLIVLNGSSKEIEELRRRIPIRKEKAHAAKKAQRRANPTDSDGNSSKRHKRKMITVAS